MPKKIKPSDVASQFGHDISEITDFCAYALEDANDHNVAAALRALNVEEYELAREFITLEEEQASAGELTPELSTKRDELMERLDEAEEEEEHVHDDDCRSYGCPKGEGRR